jgi:hypothetical protein
VREFDPGPDAEFGEDVAQVRVHRVRGDIKPLGDLTVGRALGNQLDNRELGGGQFRPVRRCPVLLPASPVRAAVSEQAADTCRVSFGACGGLQSECLV